MPLRCIFNRFSVYLDPVSNDDFHRFRIRTLSLSRAITFLIAEVPPDFSIGASAGYGGRKYRGKTAWACAEAANESSRSLRLESRDGTV